MINFFWSNLGKFKLRALLVFLSGILDGIAVFMIPVSLLQVTKPETTAVTYWNYFYIATGCYVTSLGLQWIIRKWGESLAGQLGNQTRLDIFKDLKEMSMSTLNKTHSGYLLSLVNKVSDGVQAIALDLGWSLSKIISNLSLFFIFTYLESPWLALLNLILLSVFVIVNVILSQNMLVISRDLNTKKAALMETYADFMGNISTVKKLSVFDFAERKIFERTKQNYDQIAKNQSYHANRWFILHCLFGLAFLGTMAYLLNLVIKGQSSITIFVLFITAFQLIKGNVERLSETYKFFVENSAYLSNLDEAIVKDEKQVRGKVAAWKKISFAQVAFKHHGTSKEIKVPEFQIKKGEVVAIVGKSGQGKSTFLNLLMNFIRPTAGKRMVDNVVFEKTPSSFWSDKVALVNQEIELFNLSLRENLLLNNPIEDEILKEYLTKVDLHEWLNGLKDGLDTVIGEKGLKLSAGQKQRINLLRGLLLDREILILDEPTSHLDIKTEKLVVRFLKEQIKGKTVIIVTHRPELLKLCDKSYKVEGHVLLSA